MISVVIPCLNESGHLASLLGQLAIQINVDLEIFVVDGGSTDDTITIANENDAKVLTTDSGRGTQQNAGAGAASGEYLLFLHADSRLDNDSQLADALHCLAAAGSRTAGHFRLQFDTNNPETTERLRFFEYKTRLNRDETFNGDQGLLIRKSEFKLLGGFSEKYAFLEDTDFAERFITFGRFITLPSVLHTSARRFEMEGIDERLILNTHIMAMYHLEKYNSQVGHFFPEAQGIYRHHNSGTQEGGKLNPHPFMELTHNTIFARGCARGLLNWYRLGRYGAHNLWQVSLWFGFRKGEPDNWLRLHDRYLKPVTDNPVGGLIGAFVVAAWFYSTKRRFSSR